MKQPHESSHLNVTTASRNRKIALSDTKIANNANVYAVIEYGEAVEKALKDQTNTHKYRPLVPFSNLGAAARAFFCYAGCLALQGR